jgi:hypothetical protein
MNPRLEVIARVHHESLRSALSALPRTWVVQGDVELAYAMARSMLLASGMNAVETEALIIDARREGAGHHARRFIEIPVPPASPASASGSRISPSLPGLSSSRSCGRAR